MPGKELDLTLTIVRTTGIVDNPIGIFPLLIDGGVSLFGIVPEEPAGDVETPKVSNAVVIPSGSETTDADGNVRKEGSFEVVGESNDLQFVPVFGRAQFAKGLSKTSGYEVHNKKGKLIERGGTTLTSGDIILVDGTKIKGKTFTSGSEKIDRRTGIVTLEGELVFNGSIEAPNGKEFTGELKTGGSLKLDCSNKQCDEDISNGRYLGGGGFTSLHGVSVQENGATFDGKAETAGMLFLSTCVCVCAFTL